ncbi:MAG: hypothetical protein ACTTH7_10195 [Treponema sp.]
MFKIVRAEAVFMSDFELTGMGTSRRKLLAYAIGIAIGILISKTDNGDVIADGKKLVTFGTPTSAQLLTSLKLSLYTIMTIITAMDGIVQE